jgi:outer membrane immunogenic protein
MFRFSSKLLLTAAIASLGLTAMASAADLPARTYTKAPVMPVVVAYNWSGFYLGGFAGYAWADGNATATEPQSPAGTFYNGTILPTTYGLNGSFLGGGTVGYNWQMPGSNVVFGLEGEAGYLHVRGSRQDVNAFNAGLNPIDSVNSTRIGDAYGVIAGRIGYAWDRTLIYAKGGVAFVGNSYNFNDTCNTGTCGGGLLVVSHSDTQTTYALGAGIEYAFTNNWSLKGEYLFLGTQKTYTQSGPTLTPGTPITYTNSSTDPGIHTVKVGVNYRFNWGAPVVAKY